MQWREVRVTCVVCGKTVIKNNRQQTCSLACREVQRQQRRLAAAPVDACPICGRHAPLVRKVLDQRVCSARCKGVFWERMARKPRDVQREASDRLARTGLLGSSRPCEQCGELYIVKRYDTRCCSRRCADLWRWKHGKSQRLAEQRRIARGQRDAEIGACALCRTSHTWLRPLASFGSQQKNANVLFHRDHITAKSRGGSAERNNLRYVCWFCNYTRRAMDVTHDAAIAAAGRAFWKHVNA